VVPAASLPVGRRARRPRTPSEPAGSPAALIPGQRGGYSRCSLFAGARALIPRTHTTTHRHGVRTPFESIAGIPASEVVNMKLYSLVGARVGTVEAASLSRRLAAWHDAMVAHERRLESGRVDDGCGEDCAHSEARALWDEALEAFGDRAHELVFLRSRATERSSRAPGAGPQHRSVLSPEA
jgi:hypothetical protein